MIDSNEETIAPLFRLKHPGNFIFVRNTMYLCGAPGLRILDVKSFLR